VRRGCRLGWIESFGGTCRSEQKQKWGPRADRVAEQKMREKRMGPRKRQVRERPVMAMRTRRCGQGDAWAANWPIGPGRD
jgi:hypothetical protein